MKKKKSKKKAKSGWRKIQQDKHPQRVDERVKVSFRETKARFLESNTQKIDRFFKQLSKKKTRRKK